jgi:hypothetical protein
LVEADEGEQNQAREIHEPDRQVAQPGHSVIKGAGPRIPSCL